VRVLVIDSYDTDDANRSVVEHSIAALKALRHDVDHLSLASNEFAAHMTAAEHRAYETDTPLLAEETQAGAAAVQAADALLFCYPTTLFGVPPRLKSWLERVMVMGVAFVLDDERRVRPGMKNIRYLGVVTTTPHSTVRTLQARDLGRRTFMRTLRLNCNPGCKRTFIRLHRDAVNGADVAYLQKRLYRWR